RRRFVVRVAEERVLARRPVGPRKRRGEPLRAELAVTEVLTRAVRPPGRATEGVVEARPDLGVEKEEVDLMRVLVLDDSPGRAASREQLRAEPDLDPRRIRGAAARDVDRHVRRDEAPVEGARAERGMDNCPLL